MQHERSWVENFNSLALVVGLNALIHPFAAVPIDVLGNVNLCFTVGANTILTSSANAR